MNRDDLRSFTRSVHLPLLVVLISVGVGLALALLGSPVGPPSHEQILTGRLHPPFWRLQMVGSSAALSLCVYGAAWCASFIATMPGKETLLWPSVTREYTGNPNHVSLDAMDGWARRDLAWNKRALRYAGNALAAIGFFANILAATLLLL